MADLDRYAEPPRDTATLAARREALLDQLGWLEDEAAALGPLLAGLPTWALEQAPLPSDLTVKEAFAALAALDRETYPGWVDRVQAEDTPALTAPAPAAPDGATADGDANEHALDALLDGLRQSREALRAHVAAVPPDAWSRPATLDGEPTDLYGLVLDIVRRDADWLKDLAYRLHEADLRTPKG